MCHRRSLRCGTFPIPASFWSVHGTLHCSQSSEIHNFNKQVVSLKYRPETTTYYHSTVKMNVFETTIQSSVCFTEIWNTNILIRLHKWLIWHKQKQRWIPINAAVIIPTPAYGTLPCTPTFSFSLDDKMHRTEIWLSVFIQLSVCMYRSQRMKPYTGSGPGTNWSGGPT